MAVDIRGYLDIIKNSSSGEYVRDAIIDAMNEINKDAAFDVSNKTIHEKLSNINKTYSAPAGKCWKQVTLEIEDDTSGEVINKGNQTEYDFEVDNYTAPGTYDAKEEHGENAIWGKIIVNVDHSGEWDGIVDNVVISTGDLDETGTYSASTRGLTAFKSLTFSNVDPIKDGGGYYGPNGEGYYKITFDANGGIFPDTSKQTKEMSIQAGDMIDTSPHPTKTGFTFGGWRTNSNSSTAKCSEKAFAIWNNGSIVDGEISKNWETIMIEKGYDIPLGSYKSMEIDVEIPYSADVGVFNDLPTVCPRSHHYEGKYRYYAHLLFVKVAAGEGGSTSTFVTMLPSYLYEAPIPQHIQEYDDNCPIEGYLKSDYGESVKMKWLNTTFLNYCMPSFKNSILPVQKFYRFTSIDGLNSNKLSNYKIWVPSVREFWIEGYDDQPGYPYTDPELSESIEQLYTKAQGLSYFKNLNMTTGVQRKAYFEKMVSSYPGVGVSSFRDMCYAANQSDLVQMLARDTIQGVDTTVITGRNASQNQNINPQIIGFCI